MSTAPWSAGADLHFQAFVDTLEDPSHWHTAPVGLDYPARVQQKYLGDAEEVIVCDDGAGITPERCKDATSWLQGGLQTAAPNHPHPLTGT